MQIDPFPVRLEQELKYALAYAALVSAAANGRLPRDICQRTNVGYGCCNGRHDCPKRANKKSDEF